MGGTRADIHNEIALTRARMASTVNEIEHRLTSVRDTVKEKLDVAEMVRDHPWIALGVAIAAGAAVSLSRADLKATKAVIDGAKHVPDLAASMKDKVVAEVREHVGSSNENDSAATESPNDNRSWLDRLAARAGDALADVIEPQARKLSDEMRTASRTLTTQIAGRGQREFTPPARVAPLADATPNELSPSAPPA